MTIVLFSSCTDTSNNSHNNDREEYLVDYEERLEVLGAVIPKELIEDERYSGTPEYTDTIQLKDSNKIVSLDYLRRIICIYELKKDIETSMTPEDIIDLYTFPNEEKQKEFDLICDWYKNERGSNQMMLYNGFVGAACHLYERLEGIPFIDKEKNMYTAEEDFELAKWALENINYDYINEILNNPEADGQSRCYFNYLYNLGRIDKHGRAK